MISASLLPDSTLNAVEISRVAADKLLLHSLPWPLTKRFVLKRPGNVEIVSSNADTSIQPLDERLDDWILRRQIGFSFY